MTKIIDIETHFYTPEFVHFLENKHDYPRYVRDNPEQRHMLYTPEIRVTHGNALVDNLLDINEKRLKTMDEAGIDLQILSLSEPNVPWVRDADLAVHCAHESNNALFEATKKHPDRFQGFACLAPQAVNTAVRELERCVHKLGFVGWLTHSNYGLNRYLDDQTYWPILEAAEALNVPIYIHPIIPAIEQFYKYGFALAGPSLGFQFETALCLMRMILGGVFDRFPKLRIILGHLGETMPYLMERLDAAFVQEWFSEEDRPKLKRIPSQDLKENVYVTISGRYYEPALKYTLEAMGIDRILFASDYPYESMQNGVDFIKNCALTDDQRTKIYSGNAEKLFNLNEN
ncbi:MAG: 2-keto-4-carboxy-3-hexenedioate hydratase [Chlamydiia bacterium]|nr:2-keto-4-carboxy-3-hexenedioate hydratase [Chlamydiia bacterium]MCH9616256.1 2-keto-4-carboxy-3-hexenedioate hydratase [Chlamydiia bacterium]MCH9629758.1 2-keto-4-carboxy-3-hexenedioate hydratase [Chlamydiia bacterium]